MSTYSGDHTEETHVFAAKKETEGRIHNAFKNITYCDSLTEREHIQA